MHTIGYCTINTDNLWVFGNFNIFKIGNRNFNTRGIMENFSGNLKTDLWFY